MKNMVCGYINFVWIALFLLVSTNNVKASALEKSEPNQDADLIQFKALQRTIKEGKYSEGLKEFCDKSEIGKIYTYSYYKKSGPAKTKEGYSQLLKAKYLYESLAEISLAAAKEEIDLQESIRVLEQLTRLREALIKDEDSGTFNIKIDHAVSGIISGLIFHIASKSTNSEMDKIKPFLKARYPLKKYDLRKIKAIMKSENIYYSGNDKNKTSDFLMDMIKEKYPKEIEHFKSEMKKSDISLLDLVDMHLFQLGQGSYQESNPFLSIDASSFTSDFIIIRYMEFLSRMSVPYLQLVKTESWKNWREKDPNANFEEYMNYINLDFKNYLLNNMTDFEKDLFNNPKSDKEINDMVNTIKIEIKGRIIDGGKRTLFQVYKNCQLHIERFKELN